MTLTPQAEARIDDRIRRIAPRRGGATAKQELRSHIADAAEGLARDRPATAEHVDAAFQGLGSDDAIRDAFFPRKERPHASRAEVATLVGAALLAAVGISLDSGGTASCSVEGDGSCTAATSGYGWELLVWALPPLLILGALLAAPAWAAAAIAGLYGLVALVRGVDQLAASAFAFVELLLLAAPALCIAVVARRAVAHRGRPQAA